MIRIMLTCFVLLALLLPASAQAGCRCPSGEDTVESAYDAADLVFVGTVKKLNMGYFSNIVHATTFAPKHIFKGLGGVKEIAIAYIEEEKDCDITFWEDRDYLVYAKLDKGQLFRASICSRTTFMSGAEAEAKQIQALENNFLRRMPDKVEGVDLPSGWNATIPEPQE